MLRHKYIINPFTGRVVPRSSPTHKDLLRIGLSFSDGDHDVVTATSSSSTPSSSPFSAVHLKDVSKFPKTKESLQKYPPIANTFTLENSLLLMNDSENNNCNSNKKKKKGENNDNDNNKFVNMVRQYLSLGPEFWCRSKIFPELLNNFVEKTQNTNINTPNKILSPTSDDLILHSASLAKSKKRLVADDGLEAKHPTLNHEAIFPVFNTIAQNNDNNNEINLSPDQNAALQLALEGHSLYIAGNAGTGKSFLLKKIAVELSNKHKKVHNTSSSPIFCFPKQIAVTATTGIAALTIGGQTFHRIFKPNDSLTKFDKRALMSYDIVIIDEISMFTAPMLEHFDTACRVARPWAAHLPFGGIQLILSGDFLQLTVDRSNDKNWFHRRFLTGEHGGKIPDAIKAKAKLLDEQKAKINAQNTNPVFESRVFQDSILCVALTSKMRHNTDPILSSCLDALRFGKVTKTFLSRCFDVKTFRQKMALQSSSDQKKNLQQPIFLFPTRAAAEHYNETCMAALGNSVPTFTYAPQKVVMSENGDWTEATSVLASLNIVDSRLDDDSLGSSDNNSNRTSSLHLPKNVNKIREKIRQMHIENGLIPSSTADAKNSNNSSNDHRHRKIRIRPGQRISPLAARKVQVRLKERIIQEMIKNNSKIFSKEPIVIHIDHHRNNNDENDTSAVSSKSKKATNNKNDNGNLDRSKLMNGVCLDPESSSLPINIRIKKTEANHLSLNKLEEKMQDALISLTNKGYVSPSSKEILELQEQDPNRFAKCSKSPREAILRSSWESILEDQHREISKQHSHSSSSSSAETLHSPNRVDRDVLTPKILKEGCRVMLTRNLSPSLVNGSMGVIVGFERGTQEALPKNLFRQHFVCNFLSKKQDGMKSNRKNLGKHRKNFSKKAAESLRFASQPFHPNQDSYFGSDEFYDSAAADDDDLAEREKEEEDGNDSSSSSFLLPRVRFDNGEECIVPMFPEMILGGADSTTNFNNTRISFMPLSIGYGFSVHKMQGISILEAPVVVDLMRSWRCEHLVYVAASRVRKLDQLFILNFEKTKMESHVCVSEKAVQFTKSIPSSIEVLEQIMKKKHQKQQQAVNAAGSSTKKRSENKACA